MDTLTDSTVGHLAYAAQAIFTAPQLRNTMLKAQIEQYAPRNSPTQTYVKLDLVQPRVRGAQRAAQAGDAQAHKALLEFSRIVFEAIRDPDHPPDWFGELREALLADGYAVVWKEVAETVPARNFSPPSTRTRTVYEILPTDTGPIPLAAEITALELELDSRGYNSTLNHYRQAITAFRQHDYEAANSQLRTALEDLVVRLATAHTGYVKPAKQGGGGAAIACLKQTPNLAKDDGGDLLSGLWSMAHTKGSHPGASNADETRFRVQVITATARLLLHRFP
jgi:hypothetical protein